MELALPGPEVPVIDETRLMEEFGADPEILNELKALFLEHVPPLNTAILAAARSGDLETLATSAHSLKGACATFGAPRLAQVCKDLELLARAGDVEAVQGSLPILEQEYENVLAEVQGQVTA